MEDHHKISNEELERQFADRSLNPKCFTHEAHLRLAWIHIKKYGLESAIENLCTQIARYAESLGAKDKFNTTVTIAAVRAVFHFMNRSSTNNFNDLILEFPRLKTEFKGLMNAHYSTDVFKSDLARREFVEPDVLPFD